MQLDSFCSFVLLEHLGAQGNVANKQAPQDTSILQVCRKLRIRHLS